jgi:hypothetical protein
MQIKMSLDNAVNSLNMIHWDKISYNMNATFLPPPIGGGRLDIIMQLCELVINIKIYYLILIFYQYDNTVSIPFSWSTRRQPYHSSRGARCS